MTITWSRLQPHEQSDIVTRVVTNGEAIRDVANLYNLKRSSLARKIRKLRNDGTLQDYLLADTVEKSEYVEDGNESRVSWVSNYGPIKTLDELIAAHEIDTDIWQQTGPVKHNTWTTPRARREADGFEWFQNHQITANFIKRHPEPIFPLLQPVEISSFLPVPPTRRPPHAEPQRELIDSFVFADPHFGYVKDLKTAKLTPFHNRNTLDICLQIITAIQPDRVDILGDWLDMTEWTDKFIRDPQFYFTTQPALLESAWWLSQIRLAAPRARIVLHQGNHDLRMENTLKVHLPAALDLKAVDELELPPALSLPKLLALHQIGAEWRGGYPEDTDWLTPTVAVQHGDRALSPGNTSKAVLRDIMYTVVFGHIHRRELLTKRVHINHEFYDFTAFCPACTCWTDGRVPGSTRSSQWQNGAAVLECSAWGGGTSSIVPVFIERDQAIFRGRVFTPRDRLAELKVAMDGWNV